MPMHLTSPTAPRRQTGAAALRPVARWSLAAIAGAWLLVAGQAHASVIIQRSLSIGLDNGLVGWWTFDGKDMAGNYAFDKSGNGNRGTLTGTNGLPVRTVGKIGQGLSFDGVDDNVNVGDIDALDGASQFTISAWVYQRSLDVKVVLAKWDISFAHFNLQTSDTGNGNVDDIQCQPDANVGYTTNNIHKSNTWEHWVCVFDGTQTGDSGRLKIYVNGVAQSLTFDDTIDPTTFSTAKPIRIGATSDIQACCVWNGLIDDVRIYNRALSADEIKRLYNMGR